MSGPILGSAQFARFQSGNFAMTVDGNSISDPSLSDLWTQVRALAPISGSITISNFGISGQNIQDMIARPSDVDGSYVNGKINFLFVWELTNNIHNIGRTGVQTISDLQQYMDARQAYVAANRPGQKPWRIILMTGLPRGDFYGQYFTGPQAEVEMEYCNTYLRQNFRTMGAVALVEARQPGGPFDFTDVTNGTNFPSALWRDRTHPSNGAGGGCSVLAGYIAAVLKRLPAR